MTALAHDAADCAQGTGGAGQHKRSVDAELHDLQRQTFGYFEHETNAANGLVIDKTEADWPASIAATGLALACYPTRAERAMGAAPCPIAQIVRRRPGAKQNGLVATGLARPADKGGAVGARRMLTCRERTAPRTNNE